MRIEDAAGRSAVGSRVLGEAERTRQSLPGIERGVVIAGEAGIARHLMAGATRSAHRIKVHGADFPNVGIIALKAGTRAACAGSQADHGVLAVGRRFDVVDGEGSG